jgi:hypothetical protein
MRQQNQLFQITFPIMHPKIQTTPILVLFDVICIDLILDKESENQEINTYVLPEKI